MAVVTGAEIRDRESFQAWLEARPDASRRAAITVMASRIALRVLPMVNGKGKLTLGQHTTLIKVAFWHIAISRSVRTWPDREIADVDAADDAAYASSAATYAAGAAGFAARAATYAADAATYAVAAASDAATYAATYATFAADEASYAAGAAADEVTWEYIRSDAAVIEAGEDPFTLLAQPLWQAAPPWWRDEWEAFKTTLTAPDLAGNEWGVWIEWYEPITQGLPAFNLKNRKTADALERRIALGDRDNKDKFNKDFWNRKPGEINREIAEWVAEARAAEMEGKRNAKPIFISYTAKNLESVMRIGAIVEDGGYPVFAQYKDMPPGSNFVAMMQRGLTGMGKFVPIYSPDYVLSDHCNAEWNAAYNMDPLGEKRLIVGFMLHKAELLPLQQQTVYVPLVGLTEMQAREVILSTLQRAGAKMTAVESRKAAFEKAIPIADVDAAGRLTFVHAPDVEQPFIDDDITRLPISMQKQISLLVKIIVGTQAPPLVKASLEMIVDEINTHGSMAHVPDMARGFSMLKAEEARGRAEGNTWVEGGMEVGLRDLYGMFDRFRQNFPLVMARDLDVQQSSIDPQVFDSAKFKQGHSEYLKAVKGVEQSGLASEEFVRLSQTRETQRKNIGSLAQYVPSKEDRFVVDGTEKSVDELKKGFVFDQSGTIDGVVDRVEKMTSIADSSAAVALVSAAKAILKGIWEG